jgi:hypothetical protein
MILSALGITKFIELVKLKFPASKILLVSAYLVLLFVFMESYLLNYFEVYAKTYSWSWQYGYKETVESLKAKYPNYDKIIITKKYGEPHEFILFNWPWDPAKFQADKNLIRFYQSNWYWVDGFDKLYFINDWDIKTIRDGVFTLESKTQVDCSVASRCLLPQVLQIIRPVAKTETLILWMQLF